MADVVLGCDHNNGNDSNCQNTVAKILEEGGHNVEKLSIGPGAFPDYDWAKNGKNPKGKVGVYLIASGITALADAYDNPGGFKYVYIGIRGDLKQPRLSTMEEFNSSPISTDWHGDCRSKSCSTLAGKTYPQMNDIVKDKCRVVFGTDCEELGKNILDAMGGGDGSSGDSAKSSGSSENVKGCLQKLLKHWDGDVECVFRGKNVYINKIRNPEEHYTCALYEGLNVFTDNTSVTDINPNTPNHLIVNWTGGTIEFKDEKLIFRFGEKVRTLTAVRKVVTYVKDTSSDSGDGSDGSGDSGDGSSEGSSDSGTGDGSSSEGTQSIEGKNFNVDNYARP